MTSIGDPATTLAQQVRRSGAFKLPCTANVAFPFFSPEGERVWIKEWDPRAVFPQAIAFERDTVFRQGEAEGEAVWTIVDVDWDTHRAEYVRVAPQSHTARITVKVEGTGSSTCQVAVGYVVTAFADHGFSLLKSLSEDAFNAKMRTWQTQIAEHLQKD